MWRISEDKKMINQLEKVNVGGLLLEGIGLTGLEIAKAVGHIQSNGFQKLLRRVTSYFTESKAEREKTQEIVLQIKKQVGNHYSARVQLESDRVLNERKSVIRVESAPSIKELFDAIWDIFKEIDSLNVGVTKHRLANYSELYDDIERSRHKDRFMHLLDSTTTTGDNSQIALKRQMEECTKDLLRTLSKEHISDLKLLGSRTNMEEDLLIEAISKWNSGS